MRQSFPIKVRLNTSVDTLIIKVDSCSRIFFHGRRDVGLQHGIVVKAESFTPRTRAGEELTSWSSLSPFSGTVALDVAGCAAGPACTGLVATLSPMKSAAVDARPIIIHFGTDIAPDVSPLVSSDLYVRVGLKRSRSWHRKVHAYLSCCSLLSHEL